MMRPGGAANKLGNRYEKWWTVLEFVRMLHGTTDAIRIEDPEVEKAEFVVSVGAQRVLHQVKRSHPNGKWGLASLSPTWFRDCPTRVRRPACDYDCRFVSERTTLANHR